jgi:hypothetical protein
MVHFTCPVKNWGKDTALIPHVKGQLSCDIVPKGRKIVVLYKTELSLWSKIRMNEIE